MQWEHWLKNGIKSEYDLITCKPQCAYSVKFQCFHQSTKEDVYLHPDLDV